VGYIPILSGSNIVGNIYELNYGLLNNYVVFTSISIGLLFTKYQKMKGKKGTSKYYFGLIIFYLLISFADGKRYTILTSILAVFVFYSFYIKRVKNSKLLYISGGIGAVVYLIIQSLREGNFGNFFSSYLSKVGIGVEFRDFVYTVNKFNPGQIKGYNYLMSSFGSVLNEGVASIFDINKKELVGMGSAYTWKNIYHDLFQTEFGIRTGIFSELYFAYSFGGLLVLIFFAWLLTYITSSIENRAKSPFTTIIYSVIYALFALLIVGQSTAFFGQVVLLLYVLLFNKLININKRNVTAGFSGNPSFQ